MNQRPRGWPSPVWWATLSAGVVSELLVGLCQRSCKTDPLTIMKN